MALALQNLTAGKLCMQYWNPAWQAIIFGFLIVTR